MSNKQLMLIKPQKHKLIIFEGTKCAGKDKRIQDIISELDDNCIVSDVDVLVNHSSITPQNVFAKQKEIITQVARYNCLHIIVNVYDYCREKWERIAQEFGYDFEARLYLMLNQLSPEEKEKQIDEEMKEIQKEIEELSRVD